MTYNFEFAVSAQISEKVVKEMVTKVVEEQTGKKVSSIDMKIRSVSKGIGPSETTERIFDGCTVYFVNERSDGSVDRSFKKDTYA